VRVRMSCFIRISEWTAYKCYGCSKCIIGLCYRDRRKLESNPDRCALLAWKQFKSICFLLAVLCWHIVNCSGRNILQHSLFGFPFIQKRQLDREWETGKRGKSTVCQYGQILQKLSLSLSLSSRSRKKFLSSWMKMKQKNKQTSIALR
jgi:hypothetical protein